MPELSAQGRRTLVADDDADIRALIEIAVHRAGLELVASVGDGRAALDAIQGGGIDVAVLDVMMPELTGIEVVQSVRAARAEHDPRIVLISASVEPAALDAGLSAGADDYIVKPFSPRDLAARLTSLLSAWEAEA